MNVDDLILKGYSKSINPCLNCGGDVYYLNISCDFEDYRYVCINCDESNIVSNLKDFIDD